MSDELNGWIFIGRDVLSDTSRFWMTLEPWRGTWKAFTWSDGAEMTSGAFNHDKVTVSSNSRGFDANVSLVWVGDLRNNFCQHNQHWGRTESIGGVAVTTDRSSIWIFEAKIKFHVKVRSILFFLGVFLTFGTLSNDVRDASESPHLTWSAAVRWTRLLISDFENRMIRWEEVGGRIDLRLA
jgi:hypothetical protein